MPYETQMNLPGRDYSLEFAPIALNAPIRAGKLVVVLDRTGRKLGELRLGFTHAHWVELAIQGWCTDEDVRRAIEREAIQLAEAVVAGHYTLPALGYHKIRVRRGA